MAKAAPPELFDRELADLPPDLRWREWMGRVEAAIFAARDPLPREILSRLVGRDCPLDELIADIQHELAARPYELAFVAGGWRHRTKARFADAVRASGAASAQDSGPGRCPRRKTSSSPPSPICSR